MNSDQIKEKVEKIQVIAQERRESKNITVKLPSKNEDRPNQCKKIIIEKEYLLIVDSRDCFDRASKVFVDLKTNGNYKNTLVYDVKRIEKTPEGNTQLSAER